jgi:hypothetical protein
MRLLHAGHDLAGASLLQENSNPTEDEIRFGIAGNLVPLHRLSEHRQGHPIRGRQDQRLRSQGGRGMNDMTPTQPRRARLEGMGCKRKRVEDVRFTQGKGNYVDDSRLPGMLHGDFVRSPHATPASRASTPAAPRRCRV